jgi:3-keto-5-aminohexanoate cleavage enzyme
MATLDPCSMSVGQGETGKRPTAVRRPAARMRELGVKPELEIYDTGHLEACLRLRADGLLAEPLQFSIVAGVHGGMAATPQNLVTTVRRLRPGAIWQVIVIGRANLPRTAIGLAPGGNARAGMEGTLRLRNGEPAAGGRPLARRAVMLARDLDLPAAGMADAERDLGIAS